MNRLSILLVICSAIGAGAVYWFWPQDLPPPPGPTRVETPAAIAPARQGPLYQVPASAPRSLPRLEDSDATILEALSGLIGADSVSTLFWPQDVIRKVVATIDNLPRKTLGARLNPLRPPSGQLRTMGHDSTLILAPGNAARYVPYVRVFEEIDPKRLVAIYLRLYPLFQQAYVELGYPDGYFNDRLVEVMDVLLATPEVREPPRLSVPHVLYEYADSELESRPAGQKLLIRVGTDNAARVKKKLREIRSELLAQTSPQQ